MDARSERLQRAFEVPVIVAAVLVVPLIIMQAADLTQPWYALSKLLDWGIWLVFAAEVVVMLAVVPSRRKWVAAHPLDVIIVVLTPPFLSAFAPVRLLRLLMLLRPLSPGAARASAADLRGLALCGRARGADRGRRRRRVRRARARSVGGRRHLPSPR